MGRILLVDDELAVLTALRRSLRQHFGSWLKLDVQPDAPRALAQARLQQYDVAIADLRMPAMHGLDLLAQLARLQPHCVRIVLTGSGGFDTAQRAINAVGVFRYLSKPWSDAELANDVQAALDQSQRLRLAAGALQRPGVSAQEAERLRLESLEPGITHVEWGPHGEVLLHDMVPGRTWWA